MFLLSDGALRASPWSPKTIPTYAKASVGHPPVSEIRRSMVDPSLKGSYPELRIPPRPCGRESKLFLNLIVFIVGITNRRSFVHWVKISVTIEFH